MEVLSSSLKFFTLPRYLMEMQTLWGSTEGVDQLAYSVGGDTSAREA